MRAHKAGGLSPPRPAAAPPRHPLCPFGTAQMWAVSARVCAPHSAGSGCTRRPQATRPAGPRVTLGQHLHVSPAQAAQLGVLAARGTEACEGARHTRGARQKHGHTAC